jgi:hypothetical protein
MACYLSGMVGDVLQAVGECGTSGIPRGGGGGCCLMEGLEFGFQGWQEKEKSDESNFERKGFLIEENPTCYPGIGISQQGSRGRPLALRSW